MELKKGDLINIGVADETGSLLDRCVRYVKICNDEQSKEFTKENLVSELMKEE